MSQGGMWISPYEERKKEYKFLLKDTFLGKTQGGIYHVCESLEERLAFWFVYTKESEQVGSQVLNSVVQMSGARGIQRLEGWHVGGYLSLMWSRKVLSRTGDGTGLERCTDFDRW